MHNTHNNPAVKSQEALRRLIIRAAGLIILIMCICGSPAGLMSQELPCGTAEYSQEFRKRVLLNYPLLSRMRNTAITQKIPIKAHIIRQDDMSGGLTLAQLSTGIAFLNTMFFAADIEFFLCAVEEVGNTDYYDYSEVEAMPDDEATLFSLTTEALDAVNVHFTNTLILAGDVSVCGYARLPNDDPLTNHMVLRNGCSYNSPNGTFAHEFGHYFSLVHTHAFTENGPEDPNAENVPRVGPQANCSTNGDMLCDTEADPNAYAGALSGCTYIDDSMDINGIIYNPPIDNIMSYWPDGCGGIFTPGQITRIGAGLQDRLTHTSYDLDGCTGVNVSLPSDLSATNLCGEVVLEWTDMAADELGYLIERSTTSASAGFEPLPFGGLGPDVESYTDDSSMPNTTYWYRLKSINGNPDVYSNTAQVSMSNSYCKPENAYTCGTDMHVYITQVSLTTVDNLSGCVSDGFECFTDISAHVNLMESVEVLISIAGYPLIGAIDADMFVKLFFDWNADGDFNDLDEEYLASSAGLGQRQDTIVVPNFANLGETRLRIRAYWAGAGIPGPCDVHSDSEIEDYTLNITNPLPLTWLDFDGIRRGNDIVLSWLTMDEANNKGFHVMHGLNPLTMEHIGFVEAQTYGSDIKSYSFDHLNPGHGTHFYQLEQVDVDDRIEMSQLIGVTIDDATDRLAIVPNPVYGTFTVRGLVPNHEYSAQIVTPAAKIVRTLSPQEIQSSDGIHVKGLPAGIYLLRLEHGSKEQFLRFVVLK